MTMKRYVSWRPASCTTVIPGWCSPARISASRWKRRSDTVSRATGITLTATSRPSTESRPSHTSPMPPRPSSRRSVYRSARVTPAVAIPDSTIGSVSQAPCTSDIVRHRPFDR